MRARPAALLTIAWLVALPASAQVSFGSAQVPGISIARAAPPAGPPSPTAPAPTLPTPRDRGRDLFRADEGTYAPRYDRPSQDTTRRQAAYLRGYALCAGGRAPLVGYVSDSVATTRGGPVQLPVPAGETVPDRMDLSRPQVRPEAPRIVAVPKTFYVIPRCYVGDKPPRSERLPSGCRLADLRLVPPVDGVASRQRP